MSTNTPSSPDGLQLRGAPLTSARLSRKAAMVAVAVLAAISAVIIMNVSKEPPEKSAQEEAPQKVLQPALNAAKTLTNDVPDDLSASEPIREPPPLPASAPASSPPPVAAPVKRERTSEDEARLADTAVATFGDSTADSVRRVTDAAGAAVDVRSGDSERSRTTALRDANGLVDTDEQLAAEPDLNRQAQKLAFREQKHRSAYLDARLTPPLNPFELKTGAVIPSVLVSAINSDLPGEIIAQVSQNVYDSATGRHVLVPQGAKLFGRYDSQVAFGQERLLVTWQRLIFPNGHTLELDGMPGHDQGGQSGLADRVNNHYGRIFGFGLLTSVLSAGYQLSQPQQETTLDVPSNQQVAAAAVGQQMAQLGIEIARRNLRVQPTIEVRKGYRLTVMVNKDVVFPGAYR